MKHISAAGYQLPVGTYRELVVKNRMAMSFMDVLPAMRELSETRRSSTEDDVEVERLRHAVRQALERARVKATDLTDQALAVGEPIVALVWQVQAAHHHHPLADPPSWLTSATATVRLFADDKCEPASY